MAGSVRSAHLFEGLSDKELKDVERSVREVQQPAGKEVMVRGDNGIGFMILLEGEAEVHMPNGRSRTLRPGDHFGEMALLDHEGRSASVVTKTEIKVAAIPEWEFKRFLRDHPDVMLRLLETMSHRLREAESS